jgi:hypothetical protein
MTPLEEIRHLRAENTALHALVAELHRALQATRDDIGALQTTVAQRHAARDPKKGPPGFVKRTTPAPPRARPARKKRAAAHNQARRRAEPTQIIYHACERCLALLRQQSSLTRS